MMFFPNKIENNHLKYLYILLITIEFLFNIWIVNYIKMYD